MMINTSTMFYNEKANTLSEEASTLGLRPSMPRFLHVTVRLPNVSYFETYACDQVHKDQDGDVTHWTYVGDRGGPDLIIFND